MDRDLGRTGSGRASPLAAVCAVMAMMATLLATTLVAPAMATSDYFTNREGIRAYLINPGVGNLVSRQLLLSHGSLFRDYGGFSENFLWYSYETAVTVSDPGTKWAGCTAEPGVGSNCLSNPAYLLRDDSLAAAGVPRTLPHSEAVSGRVIEAFGADPTHPPGSPVTFAAFSFGSTWIARSCGNWVEQPPTGRARPIPYIHGTKFRDDDRDGSRDLPGEQGLQGWTIELHRASSLVGQPNGLVATTTTDETGNYRFNLDGFGPGRYIVREIAQDGWKAYTKTEQAVDIDFGVGDRGYRVDFGNAETITDARKSAFAVVDAPTEMQVNVPAQITVRATIENIGPAHRVTVTDRVIARAEPAEECTIADPIQHFATTLVRDQPVTRDFTFSVTCSRPSFHTFTFDDELSITTPDVIDSDLNSNSASADVTIPVWAQTDMSVTAQLACDDRTDVGMPAVCTATAEVGNQGFGPLDSTLTLALAMPPDCETASPIRMIPVPGLADGEVRSLSAEYTAVCSHRSFHDFSISARIGADDIHVTEVDAVDNAGGDGPRIMEVFHDAAMSLTEEPRSPDLICDERLGEQEFTCTSVVSYHKLGPAPDVEAVVYAELEELGDDRTCTVSQGWRQERSVVLTDGSTRQETFVWNVSCPAGSTLHPFKVTADVNPSAGEPHAVDAPGPGEAVWVVPYCLPTVNPHGQKEPQAPGSGMNEDGFYVFGTLPGAMDLGVSIRDDASGVVFGPYENGTRIKWVEANGTEPRETVMGGNNGNGKGQALAVDYQIQANGDAQAFYVNANGVEVSVTCLVPNPPK